MLLQPRKGARSQPLQLAVSPKLRISSWTAAVQATTRVSVGVDGEH